MSTLNFGQLAETQAVAGSKRLKPWEIHKVKFMGCRVEELKGKKDPTAVYKMLITRFENETGYYEDRMFFPNDESAKRPVFKNKEGHEYEGPSNWEQTKAFIVQLINTINPDKLANFGKASSKFKSFDDVCNAIITITNPCKEKEVFIKLIGKTDKDGRVNPAFPRIVNVNKDGEVYTSDNFISNNEEILGFSDYEEGKRKEMKNAKPTNMGKVDSKVQDDNADSAGEIDDFESLL